MKVNPVLFMYKTEWMVVVFSTISKFKLLILSLGPIINFYHKGTERKRGAPCFTILFLRYSIGSLAQAGRKIGSPG